MNQWLNDSNQITNGHASPGPTNTNSMSFPQQPQTINPAQFQQTQNFLNGASRTASPAFHQPMYQTSQVIPSKRSREDSMGTSPRQSHNPPPGSRSQTPGQGSLAGYNPSSNGAPPFTSAPNAYQHLQTANGATPSPTMQQMGFATNNAVAQRVSTASPSPFSPQHGMTNASPVPSDRASRVGTPHDAPINFMQNPGNNPGYNQQRMPGQMPINQVQMNHPQLQQSGMTPQEQYQKQLVAMASRQAANGVPSTPQPPVAIQANAQNPNSQQRLSTTPQEFFKALHAFCNAKGRPLDVQPLICGRPLDALRMYQAIMSGGGSGRITKLGQWPLVPTKLGFPTQQIAQAASEIQHYWMNNVGAFEQMWLHQKQKQAQMESPTRDAHNVQGGHQRVPSDMIQRQPNGQGSNFQPHMNGSGMVKDENELMLNDQRQSLPPQMEQSHTNGVSSDMHIDPSPKRSSSVIKPEPDIESSMPPRKAIEDPFVPGVLDASRHHGPINVEEVFGLGQQIVELKPTVPTLRELGVIDIHALTMAVKSGMHGETRNALDTLITLSSEPSLQLQLELCDDLMEALVDCAQVEVDFLSEHASEISDEISLPFYEELVRSSHVEAKTVQVVPAFGSLDYDLDRAADRLICITTLIRNFSFYEPNFMTLGQSEVLQLVTRVILIIGTKDLPLRNPRNTLDFMKDIIVYLSNLSSSLHLPSKQDALCLLHFLLAFAPTPSPISQCTEKITFSSYNPNIHKYLPPAVDSLAKLLARDEPNRVYFKAIFIADGRASVPYELLTRAFGLVIAAVPHSTAHVRAQIESRKPFLLQGLLAAEILATLAPGSENPLVRSWLHSDDCFAGNILKMASALSAQSGAASDRRQQQNVRNDRQRQEEDPLAHGSIVTRTMAILRILVNKSRIQDDDGNVSAMGVPGSAIMRKETLLGAMIQKDIDAGMLSLFCHYAGIED